MEPGGQQSIRVRDGSDISYHTHHHFIFDIGCGSTDIDDGVENITLLKNITGTHMDIVKEEKEPTFLTPKKKEVFNFTLPSPNIKDAILWWKVKRSYTC